MIQLTQVVKNILILNVIFFLAKFAFAGMGLDLDRLLSLHYFYSPDFRPWQFVTHMFMHGNLAHIFFNMYALVIFGPILENRFSPKRFLFYYLVCGIGASLLHMGVLHLEIQHAVHNVSISRFEYIMENGYADELVINEYEKTVWHGYFGGMLGASGAVFGILLAFGMLYSEVKLRLLFPPIEIKAKWLVIIYGLIEVVMALRNAQGDNVAHYAHLGGMLFGFIMIKYWKRNNMLF